MIYVAFVRDVHERNPDSSIPEIRARLDDMLQGKKPEEVFTEEKWGASAEDQAKQASMMSLVGGMGEPARRRPKRGPQTSQP